jgi:hypothetical protein
MIPLESRYATSSSRAEPLHHLSQVASASMTAYETPTRELASTNDVTEVAEELVLPEVSTQLQESAAPETSIDNAPGDTLLHDQVCFLEESTPAETRESSAVDVEPPVTLTEFTIFKRLPPEMRLNIVSMPFLRLSFTLSSTSCSS